MSLQPPGWSSRESCTYSTHNNSSIVYKNYKIKYKIKTHTVLHIHTIKYKIKTHNTVHHTNCLQRLQNLNLSLSIKHVSPKFCSECCRRSQGPNLGWKAVPLLYPLECERLMPPLRLNLGYIKFTVIMTPCHPSPNLSIGLQSSTQARYLYLS